MSYISTSGNMKFDGSIIEFSDPNIYVIGTYYQDVEQWRIVLSVRDTTTLEPVAFEHLLLLDKYLVDAETGSGSGDTAKCQNALEQAVVTYLEVLNGAIFTIN